MSKTRTIDERLILLMFVLTDLVLYWIALTAVTPARMSTLPQVDFLMIHRDRAICLALFVTAAFIVGAYKASSLNDRFDSVYYALIALASSAVAAFVITALAPVELRVISRRELSLGTALFAVMLAGWRYYAAGLAARFEPLHRYFYVLGTPEKAKRIARKISRGSHVRTRARYIAFEDLARKIQRERKRQGAAYHPHEDAIIAVGSDDHDEFQDIFLFCRENMRRTFLQPALHDTMMFQQRNLMAVAGVPLVLVASQQGASSYLYLKRWMDFSAALAGLLLASPICLVTALAVKFTSPGGVFYTQERLGRNGHPFNIIKFRSMTAGVELKDESGHVLAKANDPRITPVGRIIRKHRIDEIPQLFNVLKGDMSLIGPRPAWTEFYDTNRPDLPLIDQRLAVRPGLTSLSHVLGSYTSEPEERLYYDLVYISNMSLITDLRILMATVRIVLSGKGAL